MILDYLGGSNAITMVLIRGRTQSEGRKQTTEAEVTEKRALKMGGRGRGAAGCS